MIKKIINKILGKSLASTPTVAKYIPVAEHKIDLNLVNHNARLVVKKLQQAGYQAYIVGGAVRDLLLNLKPKDFDVATNATPEQVKACFKRAFIIGKRFRLVHVVFGHGRQDRGLSEVVEVSTFRALYINTEAQQVKVKQKVKDLHHIRLAVDSQGRILRDNVWGSQQEDAARRDFSVNAMYYDPEQQIVVDFHNGFADIQKRIIRIIGDAPARYREDPVRVLRALRFSAKFARLGFTLEQQTKAAIEPSKSLLINVPSSRLFDETLKLIQTGHAQQSVAQINALNLQHDTYPLLELIGQAADLPLLQEALKDTDERIKLGKSLTASFIMAVILWPRVKQQWHLNLHQTRFPIPALLEAIDMVFNQHIGDVSGRGRLAADMREIWLQQPRFEVRAAKAVRSMVLQPRFRAAFDFFLLRAKAGEVDEVLAAWWLAFTKADSAVREDMLLEIRQQPRTKKTAQKLATKPATQEAIIDTVPATEPPAKAKRRRRRRKKTTAAPAELSPAADDQQN